MPPAEAQLPLVTVAILAYNRREALATTLGIVFERLDYPAERLEVIVVDNASTDGTAEMVRESFPRAGLIVSPENTGIGGWNQAFAAARGDWVLVLDDDCYLDGDALRRALAEAAAHGADMVSFEVDSLGEERFTDRYPLGVMAFWGCAVLIRREAIDALGGFDERLFIWAHEVEFTMRFFDRGFRHLHLPEVHAVHMKHVPGLTVAQHTRNMRNWAYVAAKLMRPRDAALAVANLLVRSVLETLAEGRQYAGCTRAVVEGARAGLSVRAPVRREVSRLYRRHFLDFTSQVKVAARTRALLERATPRTDYRRSFWRRRPRMYPSTATSARVPGIPEPGR